MILLNDKSEYTPTVELVAQWKDAYPAVDITAELNKMAAWCLSNPTNRKTRRGIDRFINQWLARCQDRGGASPNQTAQGRGLRAAPVSRDLVDVSWTHGETRRQAEQHFLAKYGCYWDGNQMVEAA